MKKVIAFAGSNSKSSINKQLAVYAGSLLEGVEVNILDLNDFELPLFGVDLEAEKGIPEKAHEFLDLIKNSDGIILSLAEHNGAYSTAFKNLFDWMSRIESKTFFGKPMLLMATSPGGRGGKSVLEIARGRFPFHNAQIVEVFSLPFFGDHFSDNKISEAGFNSDLIKKIETFKNVL
ncbi:NAD(P)H-dependent oxidoreductase [Tamlana sp. 2_MG-2023]|uniref:NADPH-dependent FMN reductase n=1 Tax=unclassified Tamlana TaxID=2614803 RepID=UPI0026E235B8|nr:MULTISPECIES: NAD(P)H-dependent oxidoreductase [unclassified Tamlana]MDO6759361.1 NAD(P)H-dependent oxidoreductase [Tamlana sp. 2_MG-2023]MDO6790500.1 NAD(P)H-dependent oxidoreductase [Tamlana sp. 1_MG-2023]